MKKLPFICIDHPRAEVRKEWAQTDVYFPVSDTGNTSVSKGKYYCNVCDRELSKDKKTGFMPELETAQQVIK